MTDPSLPSRPQEKSGPPEPNSGPNVTLGLQADLDYFPCPLCEGHVPVKTDRKGKPYVLCDHPCGVQMFVRRPEGIRRLRLLLVHGTVGNSQSLNRVLELWDHLGNRLREVQRLKLVRGPDPHLEREEKFFLSQREKVRKFLVRGLQEKKRELLDAGHARAKE